MLHFWIIVAADKQLAAWQPTRSPGNSTNAFYNPSPYLPPSLCPVLSCLIAMPFTAVKQNVRDKLKSEPGSCSRSWSGVSWLGASWQLGLATPTCMQICSSPQAATRHVNFGGHTQTSRRRQDTNKDEHGMTTPTTTTTSTMMTTSFAWMKRPNEMPLIWQMNAVACLPWLVDCLTWQRRERDSFSTPTTTSHQALCHLAAITRQV